MNALKKLSLVALAVMALSFTAFAQTVSWYNAGSQKPNNYQFDAGIGGGVNTIYISGPAMTDENVTFNDWASSTPTRVTAGGFKITFDDCTGSHLTGTGVPKDLPLLGVYTVGSGATAYNQINFYIPNNTGTEPGGTCNIGGYKSFTITPKAGFNGGSTKNLVRDIFDASIPGVYGIPGLQHYNATTGVFTAMSTCNATPSACPVSTGGVLNYIIAYGTGAEKASTGSLAARLYYNSGNSWYSPTVAAHAAVSLGGEQTNIQLVSNAVGTFDFVLGTAGAFGTVYEAGWYRKLQVSIGPAN